MVLADNSFFNLKHRYLLVIKPKTIQILFLDIVFTIIS